MGLLGRLKGNKHPIVPVVRLHGVIAAGAGRRQSQTLSMAGMAQPLDRAFKTKGAKAVALLINSPGGSPVQSSFIARRIRLLAEEKKLPVLVFCEDVAASGGYWLALAGDEIYVDDSSIVGSIGVVYAGFGFVDLIAKLGVDRRVHTAGSDKAILDPFRPEEAKDVKRLEAVQGEIHAAFIDHVKARRGAKLKGEDKDLFSGAFWAGRTAVELGLVDAIGDLKTVTREKFGRKVQLQLVNPPRRRPWWRLRAQADPLSLVDDVASRIDDRAQWARYGL